MSCAVYASAPDPAPDADYVRGELGWLIPGNRGRLLDARRTPITITAVAPETGAFEVEIGAFEDAGARWELALEDVARFQFARGARLAPAELVAELQRAVTRFDRELVIEAHHDARAETLRRIAATRESVHTQLTRPGIDPADHIARREGDPRLFDQLDEFMALRGVAELEYQFSRTLVTNPRSGEFVKGHAIVLAELGLCTYRGKILRNPDMLSGRWSESRRAEHLIARLAFTQELWSTWSEDTVTLYRGAAVDGPWPEPLPASFISTTLSSQVASAHFQGGPTTRTAVLWRQAVPVTRLVMTFLETREMNRRYREAEAVLIGDPPNRAF